MEPTTYDCQICNDTGIATTADERILVQHPCRCRDPDFAERLAKALQTILSDPDRETDEQKLKRLCRELVTRPTAAKVAEAEAQLDKCQSPETHDGTCTEPVWTAARLFISNTHEFMHSAIGYSREFEA